MNKRYLKIGLLLLLLAIPVIGLAQGIQLDSSLKPEYATNIQVAGGGNRASLAIAVLQMIAGGLIYLAGPVAVLMLAIGGVRYIVSRGDQTQMEEAKKTITYAVIGLVVIILSWAIISNVIWITLSGGTLGQDEASSANQPAPTQQGQTSQPEGTSNGSGEVTTPAETTPSE